MTSNKTKKLTVSTKSELYEWSLLFPIFACLFDEQLSVMKTKSIKIISLFVAIISMCNMSSYAQMSTIDDVRNKIFYSDFDLEKSIALISEINTLNIGEPIVRAYEGATEMLAAKHSWNPISKISFMKDGVNNINEAVIGDGANIEIRFLRFYIENSLPHYLGLSKNIEIDKKVIIDHIDSIGQIGISRDIAIYINQYMIDSGKCTSDEIKKISESIANLHFDK